MKLSQVRLYSTLSRTKEEVQPLQEGVVRIYSCGPTVYRYVHIGNLRTFMLPDILRRSLEYLGYKTEQVMNVTDVGHLTDDTLTAAKTRCSSRRDWRTSRPRTSRRTTRTRSWTTSVSSTSGRRKP